MAIQTVTTGMTQCTFGAAPAPFKATPGRTVVSSVLPAGNIMDHKPMLNVGPFGVCSSLAFPATASATSAALGVLTPMPCVPNTPAPWVPGSPTVMVDNAPALNNTCTLTCMWGGVISFTTPGQTTEMIP